MMTIQPRIQAVLLGFAAASIAVALTVVAKLAPDDKFDGRHCIIGHPPKHDLVLAFDVSDPLVTLAPREVSLEVAQELDGLQKGDRVVAMDIPATVMAEFPTVVNVCDPGDGDNEQRLAFRTAIVNPILAHVTAIRTHPESPESPIIEATLEIAHDRSLHDAQAKLTLFMVTDGLQNTKTTSVYRKDSRFPVPDPISLEGVEIHLFIVRNERDLRLQPAAVDRLTKWLEHSGAHVIMNAPGWLLLARSPKRSGQS